MKRLAILATTTVLAIAGSATGAAAHTHYLTLPNGGTVDLAGGNVEGAAWHPLHCVVHVGTAGTFAMDHGDNPVDIQKNGSFSGTCDAKPGALPRK